MKTQTKQTQTKTTPSVVPTLTPAPAAAGGFTLGLDLGDRSHYVCVLDAAGQIIHEGTLLNDRAALAALLTHYPAATVALEAGTHSPWISRYLTGLGATVIVANPRKLHAISRHERKCDRRDAVMLARLARADVALLHPLQHGSAQAQHDLLGLKLRDSLVRTRVNLINTVRFTLKSLGHAVSNPSSRGVSQKHLDRGARRLSAGGPTGAHGARVAHRANQNPGTRPGARAARKIIPSPSASSRSPAWGRSRRCASC